MPKPIYSLVICLILLLPAPEMRGQNTLVDDEGESQFLLGMEMIEKRKYEAARNAFENYLANAPNGLRSADAKYYIAFSSLSLNREDGEVLIEEFVKSHPRHVKSNSAYFDLGTYYFERGVYVDALRFYQKTDQSKLPLEKRRTLQFNSGYAYFSRRNFEQALPFFDRIKQEKSKYQYAARYYAGFIAVETGSYDKAVSDLKIAGENEAYQSLVPHLIATAYYKQGQNEGLIDYLSDVLERNHIQVKEKEQLILMLAEAYFSIGEYGEALHYFQQYAQGNRQLTSQVRYKLAYSQYMQGNTDKAIDNFKIAALDRDTLGQYASYYLGVLYLKKENPKFAQAAFRHASEAAYNQSLQRDALFKYGKASFDVGDYENTIRALRDYTKNPNNPNKEEANTLISQAYLRTKNYRLAIDHFEKLSRQSPKMREVYQKVTFSLGSELFNQSRYASAVNHFKKSLQHPVDNRIAIKAHYWMGEAYSIGRKYTRAIDAYESALSVRDVENSELYLPIHYGLGYALFNNQQYERSLYYFKTFVDKASPQQYANNYHDALTRLADAYYVNKGYRQAIDLYEKIIQAGHGELGYAHHQKGIILGILNRPQEALQQFDIVLNTYKSSPYYDDAYYEKYQLLFEEGQYDQAIEGFSQFIKVQPKSPYIPYALMSRAIAQFNLKKYELSSEDYSAILEQYPQHKIANNALLGLQEVLSLTGKTDQFDIFLAKYKQANPSDQALESIEYEAAKNQYFNQNYKVAIERLKDFMASYPESENLSEANFYIAESHFRLNQDEKAIDFYEKVVKNDKSMRVNRSINRIADIYADNGKFRKAIDYYYQLFGIAQNRKEISNALEGLLVNYYEIAAYDSTQRYARIITERESLSPNLQSKAELYEGKVDFARGRFDEALDHFITVMNGPQDINAVEAQYISAVILRKQEKYHQSLEKLYDLNKNYGIYEEWVGKSFLLIAENFISMNELFQAKETLRSIIENSPLPNIVDKARALLYDVEVREETLIKEEADTLQIGDTTLTDPNLDY